MRMGTSRRRFSNPLLIAALAMSAVAVGPISAMASEDLDDPVVLAEQAVARNPGIDALESRIAALESRARAVQRFGDPVFALEYSNVPWNTWALDDSPMSGVQLKLQQTFPLPGKNRRREAVVLQDTEARRWELEERKLQLAGKVQEAYWTLALTRQLQAITTKHIDLVDSLLESVRAKYQTGSVGQHDLLRLQVLRDRLEDDLKDFTERDRSLTATINAALHREVTTPIGTPETVSPVKPTWTLEALESAASEHRPWLKQLEAEANARRAAADLARYERWSDVTVWAGYRIRSAAAPDPGTDFFSVGVAVPLPLDFLGRSSARAAEERESAEAIEQTRLSVVDQIADMLASSLAAWERAAGKAEFYLGKLIPDATTTLDATLTAYRVDRADFASLYQAELQLLEFDRALREAVVETRIRSIQVETLAGTLVTVSGSKGE